MACDVVFYNQKEGRKPNRKEVKIMTKTEMLNFIEASGMVVNFDRKYLMRKSKDYIAGMYDSAVLYSARNT